MYNYAKSDSSGENKIGVLSLNSFETTNCSGLIYQINESNTKEKEISLISEMMLFSSYPVDQSQKDEYDYKNTMTPFSPSNDIRFILEDGGYTRISLESDFDPNLSYVLADLSLSKGLYLLHFQKFNIDDGVYNLKLVTGSTIIERKIAIMK